MIVVIGPLFYKEPMTFHYLINLKSYNPPFCQDQDTLCDWVALMHAQAESLASELDKNGFDDKYHYFKKLILKCGLGPERIATRHVFIDDFNKKPHELKDIYTLSGEGHATSLDQRSKFFDKTTSKIFDEIYDSCQTAPSHLIHTTCTGYLCPSPAQKLVSKKGWGKLTEVVHAYHMGCYAAIPSLKIARGLVSTHAPRVDIVHTELCSLHMDPLNHSMGQFVIESLFADGIISYSIQNHKQDHQNGFKILETKEEIIEASLHGMSWEVGPYNFLMTLSKDVPALIGQSIKPYVDAFCLKHGLKISDCLFAIHPGGPKIIDQIAETLKLNPTQYAHTQAILKARGNMSSATLPHVWELIANDAHVPSGRKVISLAFGPGLTIAGALLEKL